MGRDSMASLFVKLNLLVLGIGDFLIFLILHIAQYTILQP